MIIFYNVLIFFAEPEIYFKDIWKSKEYQSVCLENLFLIFDKQYYENILRVFFVGNLVAHLLTYIILFFIITGYDWQSK